MRDFPVFTTENGVGSIVLKEIPYRGVAYVTIRDSAFPTDFLQECVEFCRMAGAENVYASGHSILESYTLHTAVIRMSASWHSLPETDACLFPVTEATLSQWCEIYNRKMKNVDNAAYMSQKAAKEMLERGDGYYIHRDGNLLGIGIASDNRIDCVASVAKGAGREIVAALSHALMSDQIILEVASTNSCAIALYEALGFIPVAEVSRWYKIL